MKHPEDVLSSYRILGTRLQEVAFAYRPQVFVPREHWWTRPAWKDILPGSQPYYLDAQRAKEAIFEHSGLCVQCREIDSHHIDCPPSCSPKAPSDE